MRLRPSARTGSERSREREHDAGQEREDCQHAEVEKWRQRVPGGEPQAEEQRHAAEVDEQQSAQQRGAPGDRPRDRPEPAHEARVVIEALAGVGHERKLTRRQAEPGVKQ